MSESAHLSVDWVSGDRGGADTDRLSSVVCLLGFLSVCLSGTVCLSVCVCVCEWLPRSDA